MTPVCCTFRLRKYHSTRSARPRKIRIAYWLSIKPLGPLCVENLFSDSWLAHLSKCTDEGIWQSPKRVCIARINEADSHAPPPAMALHTQVSALLGGRWRPPSKLSRLTSCGAHLACWESSPGHIQRAVELLKIPVRTQPMNRNAEVRRLWPHSGPERGDTTSFQRLMQGQLPRRGDPPGRLAWTVRPPCMPYQSTGDGTLITCRSHRLA